MHPPTECSEQASGKGFRGLGERTWMGDLGPPGSTLQLGCSLLEKHRFELSWLVELTEIPLTRIKVKSFGIMDCRQGMNYVDSNFRVCPWPGA